MDVAAVLARAELLAELGRHHEAAAVLRAGLAERPEDVELLTGLATLALDAGDPVTAYGCATAALEHDPGGGGPALRVLARLNLLAGDPDAAVELAHRVVAQDPADPSAHALLATCLSRGVGLGAGKRAGLAAVARVAELAPEDPDLLLQAALAAERLSEPDLARRLVTAGLQADPGHTELATANARLRNFTSERAAGLTRVLASDPTARHARHALSEVVWGTLSRLASGVWIYAVALMLLSAWTPPGVLRYLTPLLMAPLLVHWTRLFVRLRRVLPAGYLSKRLWRNPVAVAGVLLAGLAALLASITPVLIRLAWNADGVRFGYRVLISAVLIAALAHLLLDLGRIRRGGDTDVATHLDDQQGNWAVWLLGLGLPIGIGWAFSALARQPGALWFALMVLLIVLGVLGLEGAVKIGRLPRPVRYKLIIAALAVLFVAGCGWLVTVCAERAAGTEFVYTVGPLSPENFPGPTSTVPTFSTPSFRFDPAPPPVSTPGG